jgi:iron complex transport system ATP-binding protein
VSPTGAVACLAGVRVHLGGRDVLGPIDWTVRAGDRWVVVGPNGSGKTTLVRLLAGWLHPTAGSAELLGHRLGQVDLRRLRPRIGLASAAVARMLRPDLAARDVVMTARFAALEPWWHHYDGADRDRAEGLLRRAGVAHLADQAFGRLSEGERQQVLLARMLMAGPELVLLDEPAAGLDLAARERLVATLAGLGADPAIPAMVFVTHHVEEIPPGFGSALVLSGGQAVASGAIEEALTAASLTAAFGLPIAVSRHHERWSARARLE